MFLRYYWIVFKYFEIIHLIYPTKIPIPYLRCLIYILKGQHFNSLDFSQQPTYQLPPRVDHFLAINRSYLAITYHRPPLIDG